MSPPNVLITRYGEVKIVDFGLAKANSQLEKSEPGIIKGKFSYLSPEAAQGEDGRPRTDIFAVGIILWEMLAGRRLFLGDTDLETVRLVQAARVPSLSQYVKDVPAELEQIIGHALARDPKARYQTARDFGRDLNRVLFQMGRPVSSFDIGGLVTDVREEQRRERGARPKQQTLIGKLIEEAMIEFTSLQEDEESDAALDPGPDEQSGVGAIPLSFGTFEGSQAVARLPTAEPRRSTWRRPAATRRATWPRSRTRADASRRRRSQPPPPSALCGRSGGRRAVAAADGRSPGRAARCRRPRRERSCSRAIRRRRRPLPGAGAFSDTGTAAAAVLDRRRRPCDVAAGVVQLAAYTAERVSAPETPAQSEGVSGPTQRQALRLRPRCARLFARRHRRRRRHRHRRRRRSSSIVVRALRPCATPSGSPAASASRRAGRCASRCSTMRLRADDGAHGARLPSAARCSTLARSSSCSTSQSSCIWARCGCVISRPRKRTVNFTLLPDSRKRRAARTLTCEVVIVRLRTELDLLDLDDGLLALGLAGLLLFLVLVLAEVEDLADRRRRSSG